MKKRKKNQSKLSGAVLLLVLAVILVFFANEFLEPFFDTDTGTRIEYNNEQFSISFIDVGQGDSTLILSRGESMLIDAGERTAAPAVIEELKAQGVSEIDYIVATHPHSDHIGGIADVISEFEVRHILMPDVMHTTRTFENMLDKIEEAGLEITIVKQGDQFTVGDVHITALSPHEYAEYSNLNNYSVVLKALCGGSSFLLMGDAEKEVEEWLLDNTENLRSDVLKAGHHGSATSTTKEFLDAVSPEYVIISAGLNNDYGHPSEDVTTLLSRRKIKTLITYDEGTIRFSADEGGVYEIHD